MTGRGILDISFYGRDTVRVARELLGKVLVRETPGGVLSGRIVETEAYTGPGDPASHAGRGPTPRSAIMFGPPGRAYVYFCYGMHHLLNVVTENAGTAGAVLVRGLEPGEGLERMRINRGRNAREGLLDGPGKISRALKISLELNGWDLTRGEELYITRGRRKSGETIIAGPRVGIRRGLERPWRFRLVAVPE
jgi:DNA-3-methyladenine glycosylase